MKNTIPLPKQTSGYCQESLKEGAKMSINIWISGHALSLLLTICLNYV